jgi:hypothetical protein
LRHRRRRLELGEQRVVDRIQVKVLELARLVADVRVDEEAEESEVVLPRQALFLPQI